MAVTTDTMSALVLESPGRLAMGRVNVPVPGPGDVLIRVEAATTCGTDLKAFLRGHPEIPMPGTLGHEYSGVVEAIGDGARFEVGQAVMGVHSAPCGTCRWCRRGQDNLCESLMSSKALGSFAEYFLIPKRVAEKHLFTKPKEISFERAALLEPLSCVVQGVQKCGVQEGQSALIVGSGAIGLLFVAALKNIGLSDIVLAGRNPERLAVASELGASVCHLSDLERRSWSGFDVVFECTGVVEIWEQSLRWCSRGGTVVLFGGCPVGSHAAFDTRRLHYEEVSLMGSFHFGTEAVSRARKMLLDPKFVVEPVLSGTRPLSDGPAVFKDLQAGRGVKYVLRP